MRLYDKINQHRGGGDLVMDDEIRPEERARPQSVHSSMHTDREADFERMDAHFDPVAVHTFDQTALKAPPPRHGYRQRWITDGTDPKSDKTEARNWHHKMRLGWRPRQPETVPPNMRYLYPSAKLTDGAVAIRVAGSILCELPNHVAKQYAAAVKDRISHQRKAIPESTREMAERQREGIGELRVTDQRHTVRGRPAPNLRD